MDGTDSQTIQDLKAKIDDVSGFVSLASHQLRSSPAIVRWYAELLLDERAGKLSEEQKKYVSEIFQASQRMIDFINALLNVSRIELGSINIKPELINFHAILKRVVDDYTLLILNKHLVLNQSISHDVPQIQADPKIVRLILKNLLSNAIKFTPEYGTITLTIGLDKTMQAGDSVKISVSDTGTGIPQSEQTKIFTKLFHAATMASDVKIGAGLGLYTVKSVLDLTGGSIRFTSEENKGTTFEVFLPVSGMKERLGGKNLDV